MIITHKIDMNLDTSGSLPKIEAVQGDAWTRAVQFSLYDQGLAWQIPDGVRTVVRFIKPDGCGGEYETLPDGTAAATASGNTLEVVLVPEALTAAGLVLMSVSLISGEREISTFQLQIDVHTHMAVRLLNSGSYYKAPWLEEAISQLNQNMADLQQDMAQQCQAMDELQAGAAEQEQAVTQLQADAAELGQNVAALQQDAADLKYVPIDITAVSNNVNTVELGATVESVTITWAVNKAPVSQTVEGDAVDAAVRSKTLSGLSVTAARTFTVTAADERDATDTATTRINFYNGVYYGALASGVVPDSEAVLALTRKLQSGRGATISYTPADGKRPSYACPTSYGTPKFVIGGFEYAWTKLGTIDFTNASGHTESYDVWQHPQDVTASMTITVS